MTDLDAAPIVDAMQFKRLAELHGSAEAEEIANDPIQMGGGMTLLTSRPGRRYVRGRDGVVVAVLNQGRA